MSVRNVYFFHAHLNGFSNYFFYVFSRGSQKWIFELILDSRKWLFPFPKKNSRKFENAYIFAVLLFCIKIETWEWKKVDASSKGGLPLKNHLGKNNKLIILFTNILWKT